MVTENRHLCLREIAAELSVFHESICTILYDFEHETRCCSNCSERPGFFLFSKLKSPLRGNRLQSIKDIKENSRRELKSIPENAFKKIF